MIDKELMVIRPMKNTPAWRAGIKAGDLLAGGITRCQNQDRHVLATAAGTAQNLHAGKARQAEIKHDKIEGFRLQRLISGIAVI